MLCNILIIFVCVFFGELPVDMAITNTSTPSGIGSNIGEDRSTVGTYMDYLEKKAVVRKEGWGKYSLEDPIFKMWIERNLGE